MIKMAIKRIKVLSIIVTMIAVSIINSGCGKDEDTATALTKGFKNISDLSSEDFETIEYINNNSNCHFELLGEMDDPYSLMDIGWLYTDNYYDEQTGADISAYGEYFSEKDAYIVYTISISKSDSCNIIGIHKDDTFGEAKTILEENGFTFKGSTPYRSDSSTNSFSKGNVYISLTTTNNNTETYDDDKIDILSVSVNIGTIPADNVMY